MLQLIHVTFDLGLPHSWQDEFKHYFNKNENLYNLYVLPLNFAQVQLRYRLAVTNRMHMSSMYVLN